MSFYFCVSTFEKIMDIKSKEKKDE
jgi:hypothetical protein